MATKKTDGLGAAALLAQIRGLTKEDLAAQIAVAQQKVRAAEGELNALKKMELMRATFAGERLPQRGGRRKAAKAAADGDEVGPLDDEGDDPVDDPVDEQLADEAAALLAAKNSMTARRRDIASKLGADETEIDRVLGGRPKRFARVPGFNGAVSYRLLERSTSNP